MKAPSLASLQRALPRAAHDPLRRLVAAADELDFALYLVGGPVRDWLLGRALRDLDLLVSAPDGRRRAAARQLARRAALQCERVVAHQRFGTARLEAGDLTVDLARTRSERYPKPGALPIVRAGTLLEDLRRRDFTVNALALPLGSKAKRASPGLLDAGTGRADLEARRLRVFHPRSFCDDPTRALRAVRFEGRLGFALSRDAHHALRTARSEGAFAAVSGARIRAEFERLFADTRLGLDPARALRRLDTLGVLAALEPGLHAPPSVLPALRRLGRILVEGPPLEASPLLTGLMLWGAGLTLPLRRRLLRRLALTGQAAERSLGFPRERTRVWRALARLRGRGALDALLRPLAAEELLALWASARAPDRRRILRHLREDRERVLPVNGDDLLALGLSGPALGSALAEIRKATLDRVLHSREDALALAREIARRRGPKQRGRRPAR